MGVAALGLQDFESSEYHLTRAKEMLLRLKEAEEAAGGGGTCEEVGSAQLYQPSLA